MSTLSTFPKALPDDPPILNPHRYANVLLTTINRRRAIINSEGTVGFTLTIITNTQNTASVYGRGYVETMDFAARHERSDGVTAVEADGENTPQFRVYGEGYGLDNERWESREDGGRAGEWSRKS